jgi:hypothetical protein
MRSKHLYSGNNAAPLSSRLSYEDENKSAVSQDEAPLPNICDNLHDDLTQTLTQHADHAKTEGSVYMKLLAELKKTAHLKP